MKSIKFGTREVLVGNVAIGGDNPVRIQSMTTTTPLQIDESIKQIIKLKEAGCEIVRLSILGKKDALMCRELKEKLLGLGIDMPIVADIHFFPEAANIVVDYVDKIRINPGNYFNQELEDFQFLEKLEERLVVLIEKCKKRKVPIRIGINHGSLSKRILSKYGNTTKGMVESAIEYANIFIKHEFYDLVFSLKSSSATLMIRAYNELVLEMIKRGWDFPLHLGVTEAGSGFEGRVKSSVGIGSLLLNGIGDTIRVSLTENPENEIEPAKELAKLKPRCNTSRFVEKEKSNIGDIKLFIGNGLIKNDKKISDIDGILTKEINSNKEDYYLSTIDASTNESRFKEKLFVIDSDCDKSKLIEQISTEKDLKKIFVKIKNTQTNLDLNVLDLFDFFEKNPKVFSNIKIYILLDGVRLVEPGFTESRFNENLYKISSMLGAILTNSFSDGIALYQKGADLEKLEKLGKTILQSSSRKVYQVEYISCPSCGRTKFDIQKVTNMIKEKTKNLQKGIKIGVMGCVVNGPGELKDCDFGYIGTPKGLVNLYFKGACVKKNIYQDNAIDELIKLIKLNNNQDSNNISN
jgi:(E)-4-hydroxy-3-methylbut-2-enyl-diphosphate synthase